MIVDRVKELAYTNGPVWLQRRMLAKAQVQANTRIHQLLKEAAWEMEEVKRREQATDPRLSW